MRSPILNFYFSDITYIKGIGPILSKKIGKLVGGQRNFDLLCHKPYAVIDRTYMPRISEAEDKRVATFQVWVEKYDEPKIKKLPFRVTTRNSSGFMNLVYFHYKKDMIYNSLPLGEERVVSGKVEHYDGSIQITHPDRIGKPENKNKIARFDPQYSLSAGVTQRKVQNIIEQLLEKIPDLPEWQTHPEMSFKQAILHLHNPKNENDLSGFNPAIMRLAYDELLANQIAQYLVHRRVTKKTSFKVKLGIQNLPKLPFQLTGGQSSALENMISDMSSGHRMFRLLQGDVGSGKTSVGLLAMLKVVEVKKQAAFMVPTTLLAIQQKEWFQKICGDSAVVEILTGNEKGKQRESILERLKNGKIDILVGTHALIQDWVEFKDLGLIVIDEQHRFGVLQRLKLSQKNETSHILLMTATPIPRSLTIATYGDMEISRITEKPAERKPIETLVSPLEEIEQITGNIKRALDKGEKIYWICPLVSESEKIDLAAAVDRYEYFHKLFGDKVGLVHGKMKEAEKAAVLQKFLKGEHKLLVSTTVIEVGIDVRDATVMFIEHAERFGMSQLHQLRGRVGRGDKKSTCILLYSGKLGEVASERLRVMKKSNDGFFIAEEDLRLRGAGEVMGTRQSGNLEFKFAVMPEHQELLVKARDEAKLILKEDPNLEKPRGQNLKLLLSLFGYDESINYISAG